MPSPVSALMVAAAGADPSMPLSVVTAFFAHPPVKNAKIVMSDATFSKRTKSFFIFLLPPGNESDNFINLNNECQQLGIFT
jgi:hypothetical protein